MSSELVLTINLPGRLGGKIRHTSHQTVTVDITPENAKHSLYITKDIFHTDREELRCFKNIRICEAAVKDWKSSECPDWAKPGIWKKLSETQRIKAHASRFDEGLGISFEILK